MCTPGCEDEISLKGIIHLAAVHAGDDAPIDALQQHLPADCTCQCSGWGLDVKSLPMSSRCPSWHPEAAPPCAVHSSVLWLGASMSAC